jgi:hypothetical protein
MSALAQALQEILDYIVGAGASIRVRYTSDFRHASGGRAELRSVPETALSICSKLWGIGTLLDHLVGASKNCGRNG